jgi:hypothetical protein
MAKPIVVVKTSLANILRNADGITIYQDRVNRINRLVTAAYLFARYIFVHEYEVNENENENDDDAFNADVYMTDAFFSEILRFLQTRTRRASKHEATLRNRELIHNHITAFCTLYRFQKITIPGNTSNLESYIARQMLTAYLNNAEMRTGTHFRTSLNVFFDVRSLRSLLRRQTTTTTDKRLARTSLSEISAFKTILTSAESYNALEGRIDEMRALGEEYVEAFIFFAQWLETVGGGTYRRNSVWYELSAAKSVHVLYRLSRLNAMLPEIVGRPPARWQTFPLRHSFVPTYVQFDLGIVASHILGLDRLQIRLEYKNPDFWKQHYFNRKPYRRGPGGREFDGTFWTDGYGVSILMRTPGESKGAGQKRKRGQKRTSRDAELFPYLHTVNRQDLQQYHDIVFADPNFRDTLYFMHYNSSRSNRRILRYTSMSRRRHLGTIIARDKRERFINHRDNTDEIRAAEHRLTQTNSYSTSTTDFDHYVSVRGETANVLGPLYENAIFRRIRWRTSIGKQRDFSLLGNLIRRKFGSNPLIIMGDKSAQTAARFHPSTQGVGLRYQLHRLGFRVLLLDEYRTSKSCLDCKGNTTKTNIKRVNPRPWQRQSFPKTSVHGLLECRSRECTLECDGHSRKWNRDLMAVCNFRQIWDAHLNSMEWPNDLQVQPRNEIVM